MPEFQFSGISEFFSMGGYASYVWPVYLLFALFLLINIIPPMLAKGKIIRQYRAKLLREQGYQQQRSDTGNDAGNDAGNDS